ncbi:MAG: hypothetical protein R2882_02280 [Gemmatimonadales bacterium]
MFLVRAVPALLLAAVVGLPSVAAAQRPTARPGMAAPKGMDRTERKKSIRQIRGSLTRHQNLLQRMDTDENFADQFEAAAERGDVTTAAAMFAQAAGVPVTDVAVEKAPETMGATGEPEFQFQQAAV